MVEMADDKMTKTGQLIRCSNEECRQLIYASDLKGNGGKCPQLTFIPQLFYQKPLTALRAMLYPYFLSRRTKAEYRPSFNPPFYPYRLTTTVDFLGFSLHWPACESSQLDKLI
jgi:hypothetical protein